MKNANLIVLGIVALAVIAGGIFWFQGKKDVMAPMAEQKQQEQQETEQIDNQDAATLKPSADYPIRPDFSKAQTFKNTLQLQKGVIVKYGDGWVGKKHTAQEEFISGELTKSVNGRSYMIGFQENGVEFLSDGVAYANADLKTYEEVWINGKSHYIFTSSNIFHSNLGSEVHDLAYISACPVKTNEACSLPLKGGLLFIQLRQNVPGAQAVQGLDFARADDQQILAEFAEIMSTLQY